jgi:hypothetical protein
VRPCSIRGFHRWQLDATGPAQPDQTNTTSSQSRRDHRLSDHDRSRWADAAAIGTVTTQGTRTGTRNHPSPRSVPQPVDHALFQRATSQHRPGTPPPGPRTAPGWTHPGPGCLHRNNQPRRLPDSSQTDTRQAHQQVPDQRMIEPDNHKTTTRTQKLILGAPQDPTTTPSRREVKKLTPPLQNHS